MLEGGSDSRRAAARSPSRISRYSRRTSQWRPSGSPTGSLGKRWTSSMTQLPRAHPADDDPAARRADIDRDDRAGGGTGGGAHRPHRRPSSATVTAIVTAAATATATATVREVDSHGSGEDSPAPHSRWNTSSSWRWKPVAGSVSGSISDAHVGLPAGVDLALVHVPPEPPEIVDLEVPEEPVAVEEDRVVRRRRPSARPASPARHSRVAGGTPPRRRAGGA